MKICSEKEFFSQSQGSKNANKFTKRSNQIGKRPGNLNQIGGGTSYALEELGMIIHQNLRVLFGGMCSLAGAQLSSVECPLNRF